MDTTDKIFKPFHIINIVILVALSIVGIYLKYDGQYSDSNFYFLGALLMCMLIWEVFSQFRFNYLVKLSRRRLFYKDDKIIVELKDIISYTYVSTISYSPSKFFIETKKGDINLELPNYNKIKLKRIAEALTERLKNLEN